MFIGSGESIQSIQSSQPISICTIFFVHNLLLVSIAPVRKNEQLKNTKSQQVEHFDFLRVEKFVKNWLTV